MNKQGPKIEYAKANNLSAEQWDAFERVMWDFGQRSEEFMEEIDKRPALAQSMAEHVDMNLDACQDTKAMEIFVLGCILCAFYLGWEARAEGQVKR